MTKNCSIVRRKWVATCELKDVCSSFLSKSGLSRAAGLQHKKQFIYTHSTGMLI